MHRGDLHDWRMDHDLTYIISGDCLEAKFAAGLLRYPVPPKRR
jgi:hypothetical protein